MVTLAVVLIGFSLGNFFFYEKWQQSEATIARQNSHLEQVAKDLTTEKSDVESTLAECNGTLASVQAKPTPAPVICPALPPAPVCPPTPAPIIAPEPQACPPMPVCPMPAPTTTPIIAPTPEPVHIVQHYYFHPHVIHRRHHATPAPCCKCEWKWDN